MLPYSFDSDCNRMAELNRLLACQPISEARITRTPARETRQPVTDPTLCRNCKKPHGRPRPAKFCLECAPTAKKKCQVCEGPLQGGRKFCPVHRPKPHHTPEQQSAYYLQRKAEDLEGLRKKWRESKKKNYKPRTR